MRRTRHFALMALAMSLLMGCIEEEPFDKYARPDWLAGKVFTQITDTTIFEEFTKCLQRTGYDTILNTSGSYTVFAPNNEAFDLFFQEHPTYNSVEDIPLPELEEIVKYHLVQNPWTKEQLRSLDVYGWIDPKDETNDEPRGYKRETLLSDKDLKYGTRGTDEFGIAIVDTTKSSWYRRVATDSRKYVPIFFKSYFDIYDLSLDDYTFYFDRTFQDNNDIFYMEARVLGPEIFAENGFIYNIDRVVTPARNAYQIIAETYTDKSYSRYLNLVNLFPEFQYNQAATFDQPGAELGLNVDSLFELSFPELAFDLTREKTSPPPGAVNLPGNVTIRYHHGMIAPTNEALKKLEDEYLPGGSFWDGIDNAPLNIKRIVANSHLSMNSIYRTDLELGFFNGEQDIVSVSEDAIIHKEYGSNASFLGTDEAIVPRAFSSVTGPIYLRKGFAKIMQAIEESGLLPALKRERPPDERYMLFVESDQNTSADSSFIYDRITGNYLAFQISANSAQQFFITKNDLRTLFLNHIAIREPQGLARKEFIPNLAGNFLVFNNETGEVRGTANTTVGYNGGETSIVIPRRIDINADNGSTYEIDDWFSFSTTSLYLLLQSRFPEFFQLIVQAELAKTSLNQFTFISKSENYTVFAPNSAALNAVQADTLPKEDLQKFILAHFLRKQIVFTDGYAPSGYYETVRPDESSSEFGTVYTKINIETATDEIRFKAREGGYYATVAESDSTNMLAGQILSEGQQSTFPMLLNNAVVHKIDRALLISELDVSQ
ncbi:MAG: fasciclin domain-containing protein [Bacteroidales bacterium]|nr:fasciclin domain-containing protein [Bacteroidales bacterium]